MRITCTGLDYWTNFNIAKLIFSVDLKIETGLYTDIRMEGFLFSVGGPLWSMGFNIHKFLKSLLIINSIHNTNFIKQEPETYHRIDSSSSLYTRMKLSIVIYYLVYKLSVAATCFLLALSVPDIPSTVKKKLSFWHSICYVGWRWVNQFDCMDTVNWQDGVIMWRKVGCELVRKYCHVVLFHIVMSLIWIWNT